MSENKSNDAEITKPEVSITKFNNAPAAGKAALIAALGLRAAQVAAYSGKATSEAALKTIGFIQKRAGFVKDKGSNGVKAVGSAVKKGTGAVVKGTSKVVGAAAKHPKGTAAVAGGVAVAVAAGAVATKVASGKKETATKNVGKTQGGKTKIITSQDKFGNEVKILEIDGVYQSATYTAEGKRYDLPFETYRAFDVVFSEGIPSNRLLMIGGGGFTFPKYVLAHHEDAAIDVLEPDTSVVKIARENFFLSDAVKEFDPSGKRMHIIGKDGEGFLKFHAGVIRQAKKADAEGVLKRKVKGANEPDMFAYDSIINDAFNGKNACSELTMYGPLSDAKACLSEGGLYVLNVADPGVDDILLKRSMEELGRVFQYVHVIPCADDDFGGANAVVLVATDGEYAFTGETQIQKTEPETLEALDDFADGESPEPAKIEATTIAPDDIPGETIVSENAKRDMERLDKKETKEQRKGMLRWAKERF